MHEQTTSGVHDGGWQVPGHRKIAWKVNNPMRTETHSPGLKVAFDSERDSSIEDIEVEEDNDSVILEEIGEDQRVHEHHEHVNSVMEPSEL